jgi:hypothetical protein
MVVWAWQPCAVCDKMRAGTCQQTVTIFSSEAPSYTRQVKEVTMSFVIGNTLHCTGDGHLVEFDADGFIIGTVDPESLSLAARSAFSQ